MLIILEINRMATLMEILNSKRYRTDKHTSHSYVQEYYEDAFKKYQDKEISFLEIGVLMGESMKLWCDYFKNAKNIVGVDTFERDSMEKVTSNLKNYNLDLWKMNSFKGDEDKFKEFKEGYPDGFDIIVEDGLHTSEAQIKTFKRYSSLMKKGGLYIIEDINPGVVGDITDALPDIEMKTQSGRIFIGQPFGVMKF